MPAIDSVSASGTSPTSAARTQLSDNFDTFLSLLTAQLSNQDPLDPMDSAQFTEQLVQYSQVEQQITTNDQLASLLEQTRVGAAASASAFLGHTATISTATAKLGEDGAVWAYDAPGSVGEITAAVKNAAGNTVYTAKIPPGAGTFEWSGRTFSGAAAPEGFYTLSLSAKDAAGEPTSSSITVDAKITGIAPSASGYAYITALGEVPYALVKSIHD
jgi:flagellar basal-body rod modification protein FlgD